LSDLKETEGGQMTRITAPCKSKVGA
jgi:hypothetical protein